MIPRILPQKHLQTSANIEGLKFILLALLMLPKDETRRLNTENNATYFKRGTTQTNK